MRRATGPTSAPTRSFISPAALFVNVIARSSNGEMPRSAIRYEMRCVSRRVLPDPAPATTRIGPSGALTASRWTGFSPSRSSAASTISVRSCADGAVRRTLRRRTAPHGGPPARSSWCVGHEDSVQVFGPWAGGSGRRTSVRIEPQLLGGGLAVRRAEGAQQLRAVLVQPDGERAGGLVQVEREVGLPVRVQGGRVRVGAQREP